MPTTHTLRQMPFPVGRDERIRSMNSAVPPTASLVARRERNAAARTVSLD